MNPDKLQDTTVMQKNINSSTLRFGLMIRILALLGAVGGCLSALTYGLFHISEITLVDFFVLLLLAPPLQAIILLAYGVIGYPFYKYLAKRNATWFR